MALSKCPQCEHEVSANAYTCPSCGHPLKMSPGARALQAGCGCLAVIIGLAILGVLGTIVAHGAAP